MRFSQEQGKQVVYIDGVAVDGSMKRTLARQSAHHIIAAGRNAPVDGSKEAH